MKKNTLAYEHNFARVESVKDNQVELRFDLDRERWPWLMLPPQHPVLVEKYQYFGALTAGWATGAMAPDKYTALTRAEWYCPLTEPETGYASRGHCSNTGSGFDLSIFDDRGHTVATFKGQGAIIEDRDFKAWRAATRAKVLAATTVSEITCASPETVGLGSAGISFISGLQSCDGSSRADALVTSSNGFYPAHPFHTGSGDHVNAAHLIDCALQTTQLALGAKPALRCIAGEARFKRFVELDVPFEIRLLAQESDGAADVIVRFAFSQLGKENAFISLRFNQAST